jgi:hypothetical protein
MCNEKIPKSSQEWQIKKLGADKSYWGGGLTSDCHLKTQTTKLT